MQIIKNTSAVHLTVDEFIKVLEEDLLNEIIALIITLDEGIDLADQLFSNGGFNIDPRNQVFNQFLDKAKEILEEAQDGDESEDNKVDRLYNSFLEDLGEML